MGDLNVKLVSTQKQLNHFTRCLLRDIQALEIMLRDNWFDDGPIHIGAEQEICLIDNHLKPSPVNLEVLDKLDNELFTTELAKFNLEANLLPKPFTTNCFSQLESEIDEVLHQLKTVTDEMGIDYIITGILPTLRKFDLEMENLTPLSRYHALVKAISKLRGKQYELRIRGIDELNLKHDSAMLEACNTSFQVHLQVDPDDFVEKYNVAQLLTAPVLAIASNSPLLFGKRLWNETRIALFQQSVDTRVTSEHLRDRSARVMFGNKWLKDSILDLYREDIARFRVMLMANIEKDCLNTLKNGQTPKLKALTIHNSTVYRWNRPCYGISPNGKPHLRIENRIFPAGPSVIDQVSNAAFWLGLMNAFGDHYPNVSELMDFDDAKSNFMTTAFNGINTELRWFNGKKVGVRQLIKDELLPICREGLEKNDVNPEDINRYLEVIEARNETRRTGATWLLNSFSSMSKECSKEEVLMAITSCMSKNQKKGMPIHEWELANLEDISNWHPSSILVEEFMTTDLFTVHKEDIPELVADMMDWQRIRYTPVEDDKGNLIGLLSSRMLMRYFCQQRKFESDDNVTVEDLMIKTPITIDPESTIFEAMNTLRERQIGCLPVVKKSKLVGIVTEGNFLNITAGLLKAAHHNRSNNSNEQHQVNQ
ncbi:MAG: glutamate-cysteine ligase family protein [Bacteroidota bacterium]